MEGQPDWFLAAVLAVFGLMWLAAVPALAAIGCLLGRRPRPALILFAAALLCEAILSAVLFFFDLFPLSGFRFDLPIALTGLSLLLAGAVPFVAALRGARTYAVALPIAAVAVAAIVAAWWRFWK